MSKASDKINSQELYKAILTLKDEDECRRFFKDLCTIAELRAMEQRYDVAVLLEQGLVYSDILERTGASSATISRVNRALNYGENGYKDVLARMQERQS
ncbi:MAG: TrpR-like protein [Oscillospiraceae bacterium]|nr:TrpR-like protein [Oscillospiraceae bacterium]